VTSQGLWSRYDRHLWEYHDKCVMLNGEDLSCNSNKIESVRPTLRKCPYDKILTSKAYLSAITVTNISKIFYLQDGGENQLALIWNKITSLSPSHTHTHPFNGPLSRTTRVSQHLKSKTNLDFTAARDSEWQWHQLGHMQVCTSLQTDNHASTPTLSFLQAGCPSCRPTSSVNALSPYV